MIISFLAPKGGVGSSTLAILTAACQSGGQKVLLIDAAEDPSIDLYTSTENSVVEPYFEGFGQSAGPVRGIENLRLAQVAPDEMPDLAVLKNRLELDQIAEAVIDWGAPTSQALNRAVALSDRLIVVLTQDNTVLRAADRLLGTVRNTGAAVGFIINQWEDRAVQELGDREEIFSLLEDDYYGSLSYDHSLRFVLNQGKPLEVSGLITGEIQEICAKIYQIPAPEVAGADEDVPQEDGSAESTPRDDLPGEAPRDGDLTTDSAPANAPVAVAETLDGLLPEATVTSPDQPTERESVLSRIRSFFRGEKG